MALKKQDYIDALGKAGVSLKGDETVDVLKALAEQHKVEVGPQSGSGSDEPVTVKYRDHKGEPTERTFSKDVHGDDFAKLADEFKATNASRIIA